MIYVILLLLSIAVLLFILAVFLKSITTMLKKITIKPIWYNRMIAEKMEEKKRNLERILTLFADQPKLTNAMIRQALGFDDRVIVNYMDELEKIGKVRQVGKTGVNAHYEIIS